MVYNVLLINLHLFGVVIFRDFLCFCFGGFFDLDFYFYFFAGLMFFLHLVFMFFDAFWWFFGFFYDFFFWLLLCFYSPKWVQFLKFICNFFKMDYNGCSWMGDAVNVTA